MRQTMFIFDKDNNRVGYARAKCSEDANMIMTDSEIFASNKAEKTKEEWYNCITAQLSDEPLFYGVITILLLLIFWLWTLVGYKCFKKIRENRQTRFIRYEVDANSSSVMRGEDSIQLELDEVPHEVNSEMKE